MKVVKLDDVISSAIGPSSARSIVSLAFALRLAWMEEEGVRHLLMHSSLELGHEGRGGELRPHAWLPVLGLWQEEAELGVVLILGLLQLLCSAFMARARPSRAEGSSTDLCCSSYSARSLLMLGRNSCAATAWGSASALCMAMLARPHGLSPSLIVIGLHGLVLGRPPSLARKPFGRAQAPHVAELGRAGARPRVVHHVGGDWSSLSSALGFAWLRARSCAILGRSMVIRYPCSAWC
ncbi:hypothetical protein Dimus_015684 [Dionaea muscipula]